jgi:putative oxidoreductase
MKIGRLLLRLILGGFFVGHGTQKLFGWFGGNGLSATGEFFEQSLGLKPGKAHASAAGVAEAGGGALLVVGLETPLAAAAIIATMLTAIRTVHFKNGPWASNGGYEYNAVVIAAMVALVELGPGPLSLDSARGRERAGARWALAALAAGGAGALGAHLVASAQQQAPAPPSADANGRAPAEETQRQPNADAVGAGQAG